MMSKWLGTALLAILSLYLTAGARAEDKKTVPVTPARPADAWRGLQFTGRVEAAEQAGIGVRVAGTIEQVVVDVGDRVKKGQVLIELSAPELKDDLDAATARLDQAKAEVEQAEAAVQAAKAQTAQAEAALEAARAGVKRQGGSRAGAGRGRPDAKTGRQQRRIAGGYRYAPAQAEAATATVEEAEARVKTAEAARAVAAAEIARAQAGVRTAQAGVEVAQAGARPAQTQLGFTRILAPFDGVVARRTVDAGTTVGPPKQGESAPLLTLMRNDVVHVVFDVDERSASHVAVGGPAVIHVAALGDAEFKGKVTRTAGAFNPDTGTLRAVVDLPNPDGKLRSGMFVTVAVMEDAGK